MATILIVDDRFANRDYLTTLLGYGGHRLLQAAEGAAAQVLVHSERLDLVITDILMPTMDGFEFARRIRADPDPAIAQTPIIFFTATYSAREGQNLARAAGVKYVITKPARPQLILDTVQAALGTAQTAPEIIQSGPPDDVLRTVSSKLTEKMSELSSLEHRLAALVELMPKLAAEREPERLLNIACDAARAILGAQYAAIGMLDDNRQNLRRFVTSGMDPETVARIGPLPTGKGVLGKLLAEGQPLRLADLSADPSSVGFPPGHPPMRAFLGVPIASGEDLYGRLYVTEKIGALEFSAEDEQLAAAVAAQVAVAYENATRYDEIQAHAARLQLEMAGRQQSEERFAKAFRASPAPMAIMRLADTIFVDANDQFLQLLGQRRDDVIDRPLLALNMFANLADLGNSVLRMRAEGRLRNLEMDLLTKTGERRSVLYSLEAVELGGVAHLLTIIIDTTERKQAELALRQLNADLEQRVEQRTAQLAANEAKFRTLFDVLPVGVSILDDQRRVVDANAALARILKMSSVGLTAGDYTTRTFIHPDGTPVSPPEFPSARVLVEQRPVFNVAMGVVAESGETVWVDISAAPLPVAGFSAVAVTADVTEHRRIEAALRDSEEKFSKAFHASSTGVLIARNDNGQVIEVNDSFLRLVGFQRAEVLGRSTPEIGVITAADRERVVSGLREQGRVHELEIGLRTKSGETRTVLASVEGILIGDEPCSLSIMQDITERKQIQQALANERDLLQALMDNVPDTIYFKDRDSRFTRINQAQARFLGVPAPDMAVGKSDADYEAPQLAGEAYAEEQQLLSTGQPLVDRVEYNPTPAGVARWLSATKVPLKDASGQVMGMVGISRDITPRMLAEQELHRLNQQLADRVRELSGLSILEEQLQSCLTIDETYPLTAQFMRQLAPGQMGAVYVVQAGRTELSTAGSWGSPAPAAQVFGPDDCWALRRGQVHLVDSRHPGERCRHLNGATPAASLCLPLMAADQALGVLHLRVTEAGGARAFEESIQQLAQVVADSVALTWANLTLRESLRQQAIRDPLTGLFNRRFMEESLGRELSRAARNQQSVSLIMMDIDHFKQVNDRFGHETGDVVLRALGHLLQANSRGSDIPCRYGGEEFLLILPEASLENAGRRAEHLRDSFKQMSFEAVNNRVGPVTLSLGVAAFPQHGQAMEVLLRAADAALYRAKSEGRDRVSVAGA